jgi:hypothetical protein
MLSTRQLPPALLAVPTATSMLERVIRSAHTLPKTRCCCRPLTRAEVADELMHQLQTELFLGVVVLVMFLLVQDEGVVNGDIKDEPHQGVEPFATLPADLKIRLTLSEHIDTTHVLKIEWHHFGTCDLIDLSACSSLH